MCHEMAINKCSAHIKMNNDVSKGITLKVEEMAAPHIVHHGQRERKRENERTSHVFVNVNARVENIVCLFSSVCTAFAVCILT